MDFLSLFTPLIYLRRVIQQESINFPQRNFHNLVFASSRLMFFLFPSQFTDECLQASHMRRFVSNAQPDLRKFLA